MTQELHLSNQSDAAESKISQDTKVHSAEFAPGEIVSLKSNPTIRGAVVTILPGQPENRFKMFVDGQIQTYYTSQI